MPCEIRTSKYCCCTRIRYSYILCSTYYRYSTHVFPSLFVLSGSKHHRETPPAETAALPAVALADIYFHRTATYVYVVHIPFPHSIALFQRGLRSDRKKRHQPPPPLRPPPHGMYHSARVVFPIPEAHDVHPDYKAPPLQS